MVYTYIIGVFKEDCYRPVGYAYGSGCAGYGANWLGYMLMAALYDGGCCWGGYGVVANICCCDDGCGCSLRGGCDCGCSLRGDRDTGGLGLIPLLFI